MLDPGLKDRVVLITGGNNPYGIGAATAKAFAAQGKSRTGPVNMRLSLTLEARLRS